MPADWSGVFVFVTVTENSKEISNLDLFHLPQTLMTLFVLFVLGIYWQLEACATCDDRGAGQRDVAPLRADLLHGCLLAAFRLLAPARVSG